jgi:multidrug efflux pump subunit AcrA (membrane-fusion protein)
MLNPRNQSSPPPDQNPSNQLLSLPAGDGGDDDDTLVGAGGPPWWRRRSGIITIAIILLIIVLGAILISILTRPKPPTYQYAQATKGNISQTVSATGPLQSATYNLIFEGSSSSGKITAIDVKVGQTVKQGQLLASLDKTLLQDTVNEDQTAVNNDIKKLDAAYASAGATAQQGAAQVSSAQTTLSNGQDSLNQQHNLNNANVANAQAALDNAKIALNNAKNVADATINSAKATRDQAILTCNNNSATATAQAKSSSTSSVSATETAQAQANAQATQAAEASELATASALEATETAKGGTTTSTTTTSTTTTSKSSSTSSSGGKFVRAPLSVLSAFSDCTNAADQTYNQAVATANQSVSNAEQTVTSDQNALNVASANAGVQNTTNQNTVNTAKSGIITAETGANVSNASENASVVAAQAQLAADQATLIQAQNNLSFADLKSPHDGVVSVINGTVGGQPGVPINGVSSTTSTTTGSTFMQIVDNTNLQIQANVNESDMANVQNGEQASFTVNAYPSRTFTGTVAAISPLGQTSSNVVSYPVYINIPKSEATSANLLPNMTANVTITVVQQNNVIVIPTSAVNFARNASRGVSINNIPQLITPQKANQAMDQARQMMQTLENQNPSVVNLSPSPNFVIEPLGNTFVAKPIVTGLTDSSGTQYEVLTGLSAGETIITGVQGSGTGAGTGGGGTGGGATGG